MIFRNQRGSENSLSKTNESVNNIDATTPYMLRRDGELLVCGDIHPYIKMYYNADFAVNKRELDDHRRFLDWFYENTNDQRTKELIVDYIADPTEENFEKLNDRTNQEFCRVRTSNFKYKYGGDNGEIYFRISSANENWFDAIWLTVNKFSRWIKTVTVMKDFSTFGKHFDYCQYRGAVFNKMPTDEFLTLSGNPDIS